MLLVLLLIWFCGGNFAEENTVNDTYNEQSAASFSDFKPNITSIKQAIVATDSDNEKAVESLPDNEPSKVATDASNEQAVHKESSNIATDTDNGINGEEVERYPYNKTNIPSSETVTETVDIDEINRTNIKYQPHDEPNTTSYETIKETVVTYGSIGYEKEIFSDYPQNVASALQSEKRIPLSIASAANKFGDDLYKKLAKKEGNIVFSPFSVHTVLALLTLGANGKTQKQLLSKLYFRNLDHLIKAYSEESGRYNRKNQKLRIANNIFYDEQVSLLKKFKTGAKRVFQASPKVVDFTQLTQATKIINSWVAKQTKNAIPKLLEKDSLEANTLVMLLNAFYFKGEWSAKFNRSKTIKNFDFYTPKKKVKCNMMVKDMQPQNILEGINFRILQLPFRNNDIKIAFIMPSYHRVHGQWRNISMTDELLNDKSFFEAISNLYSRSIRIMIPKFKLSESFSFKDDLISMGIEDIFQKPDFSNLFATQSSVAVGEVIQKAIIEINENGATAAAATSAKTLIRSGPPAFIFNVPFLFVLYDSKNEVILMRGRVEDPTL